MGSHAKVSKPERFILFALGECQAALAQRFAGKPMSVVLSKAAFIELVESASIIQKQPRAIYRNLEQLEKRDLIRYDSKELALTPKGEQLFSKIGKDFAPYFSARSLAQQDVLRFIEKAKTRLNA